MRKLRDEEKREATLVLQWITSCMNFTCRVEIPSEYTSFSVTERVALLTVSFRAFEIAKSTFKVLYTRLESMAEEKHATVRFMFRGLQLTFLFIKIQRTQIAEM